MGFLVGLFLGFALGLGLVVAFVRSENLRSSRRAELVNLKPQSKRTSKYGQVMLDRAAAEFDGLQENILFFLLQAATIAAFSKMTVEDSKKILPAEFYPSWVVFTQQQKAASELIRSSVEPVLEQYKSLFLDSIKFSKLTLGTVAPQFTVLLNMENI
ncbi:hypothetical protein Taro_040886 [Colocasia esculenta]|uniref:Uncharacterized protein n=1 Tax=Colocasia esculenta TaxID=4460 RepID=A0A843WEC6_COLES|nr:hypothetical protein [Colocasia esculenta]